MCGIVGIHINSCYPMKYTELQDYRSAFTSMLVSAQQRGRDATGVMVCSDSPTGPELHFIRAPVVAEKFVQSAEYKNIMNKVGIGTYSIVGHTRASTGSSAYDNYNNHPHHHGKFIGVHNGMIRNDDDLWKMLGEKGYSGKRVSKCDSEAIFALADYYYEKNFAKAGSPVLRFAAEKLVGWFSAACVFLESPKHLYLIKDGTTPLYGARVGSYRTLFASQEKYIKKAWKYNLTGTSLKPLKIEENSITVLASWKNDSGVLTSRFTPNKHLNSKFFKENKDLIDITSGKANRAI